MDAVVGFGLSCSYPAVVAINPATIAVAVTDAAATSLAATVVANGLSGSFSSPASAATEMVSADSAAAAKFLSRFHTGADHSQTGSFGGLLRYCQLTFALHIEKNILYISLCFDT